MQAAGIPLEAYLALFRDRQADLLARGEASGHRRAHGGDAGPGASRLARDAPAAAGLLRLLAFLAPEPVPLALLLAGRDATPHLGTAAGTVAALLGDPLAAADAVGRAAPVLAGRPRLATGKVPGPPAGPGDHPAPG